MARTRINGRPSIAPTRSASASPPPTQLQGKELSYNNLNDTDAAYELVAEFDADASAAVAIIKHANPCGVALGAHPRRGLRQGARLRSGERVRRDRRAEPPARCRGRARDRQDLHRGDHRAGRERASESHSRREEESAPPARRRPARPESAGPRLPLARGRLPGAGARQRRGLGVRPQGRDQAQAEPTKSWPTSSSPSP